MEGRAAELVDDDVRVLLGEQLLGYTAVGTMLMVLLSGLAALRSLRLIEPVNLLR